MHNFYQIADPSLCFTFVHPNPNLTNENNDPSYPNDNSRYKMMQFEAKDDCLLHGFIGYFDSKLYKDVYISIHPETHSPDMFSWFPIFFPIKVFIFFLN